MIEGHNGGEPQRLGIAEAKRRFAELMDRVEKGERFVISDVRGRLRRRKAALVPADEARSSSAINRVGLAAVAGVLADWEDLPELIEEIYSSRRRARDRTIPKLD